MPSDGPASLSLRARLRSDHTVDLVGLVLEIEQSGGLII
jgi:hypothetical protein